MPVISRLGEHYPSLPLLQAFSQLGASPLITPVNLAEQLENRPAHSIDFVTVPPFGQPVIRVVMGDAGLFAGPITPVSVVYLYPVNPDKTDEMMDAAQVEKYVADWQKTLKILKQSQWEGQQCRFYVGGVDWGWQTEKYRAEQLKAPEVAELHMDAASRCFTCITNYFDDCNTRFRTNLHTEKAAKHFIKVLVSPEYKDIYTQVGKFCIWEGEPFERGALKIVSQEHILGDNLFNYVRFLLRKTKGVLRTWRELTEHKVETVSVPGKVERKRLWRGINEVLMWIFSFSKTTGKIAARIYFSVDTDGQHIRDARWLVFLPKLGYQPCISRQDLIALVNNSEAYTSVEVVPASEKHSPHLHIKLNEEKGWKLSRKYLYEIPAQQRTNLWAILFDGYEVVTDVKEYENLVQKKLGDEPNRLMPHPEGGTLLAEAIERRQARVSILHLLVDGDKFRKKALPEDDEVEVSDEFSDIVDRAAELTMSILPLDEVIQKQVEDKELKEVLA